MSTYPGSLLRQGSSGTSVAAVQKFLSVVGDFGPTTTAAVKAYQTAHGLTADGIVGPATWDSMFPVVVPPPPPPPPPPTGNPAWRGDYQNGWAGWRPDKQLVRQEQLSIVTSPARKGFPHTGRFMAGPGDYTSGDTGRVRGEVYCSVADTGTPANGQTMWWSGSFFLPPIPSGVNYIDSNAESRVGNGWGIITQWHGDSSGGNPNIALGLTKGTPVPSLLVTAKGSGGNPSEWRSGPLPIGAWNDWVAGVTWSSGTNGRLILRLNGATVVNAACSNLYSGLSGYFKQGFYGSQPRREIVIYHTATRRGLTEASVALPPK